MYLSTLFHTSLHTSQKEDILFSLFVLPQMLAAAYCCVEPTPTSHYTFCCLRFTLLSSTLLWAVLLALSQCLG